MIQLEIRQAPDQRGENLLNHVAGVVFGHPPVPDVTQQQRFVQRHELAPTFGIRRIADAHEKTGAGLHHKNQYSMAALPAPLGLW